jgi:hypothetical protein
MVSNTPLHSAASPPQLPITIIFPDRSDTMASSETNGTSMKEHQGTWQSMDPSENESYNKERPQGWSPTLNHHSQPASTEHSPPLESKPERIVSKRTSSQMQKARGILGLHPSAPIDETHDLAPHQDLLWSRIRLALREPFAEFLGVFVLVMFGDGSVAQVMLSQGQKTAPGQDGFGAYQSISWGWGK